MNYEIGNEVAYNSFDGKSFACIIVQNSSISSDQTEKQRILLVSTTQLLETIPIPQKKGFGIVKHVHLLKGNFFFH